MGRCKPTMGRSFRNDAFRDMDRVRASPKILDKIGGSGNKYFSYKKKRIYFEKQKKVGHVFRLGENTVL